MKVTIIIPVYNTSAYLRRCIDSVLSQTYKEIELILVDDGSTDGSSEILDSYKDRATVIHQENSGPSVARNVGLEVATGEIIWFIDSDDYLLLNAVELMIPYFKEGIDVVRVGRGIPERMFNTTDYIYPFLGCTPWFLYRKSLIDKLQLRFVKGLNVNEDGLFCLEAVMNCNGYYMAKENPYVKVNRQESLCNQNTEKINEGLKQWRLECEKLLEKYKDTKSCKYMVEYINNYIEKREGTRNIVDYITSPTDPIDYVVLYVDSSDKNWVDSYNKYFPNDKINPDRFGQNETLKYLLRGVEKYINWVRNVYLVVSEESQVPSWVNREQVHIVYHKDIIPNEVLPTFNSMTIEHFLYRIPGLSEKFIYANDDTFIMQKLSPRDFFLEGKPRLSLRWEQANSIRMYHKSCLNAMTLIYKRLGLPLDERVQRGQVAQLEHFILPKRKSLCEKAYKMCKDVIDTSLSKKRNYQNYVYLDSYLTIAYKNNADYVIKYDMVQRNKTKSAIQNLIEHPKIPGLCIEYSDPDEDVVIRNSFDKVLPTKSKYERND